MSSCRFSIQLGAAGCLLLMALPMGAQQRVVAPQRSLPAPQVYQGPLRVDRIAGTVDLRNGAAPSVQLEMTVRNAGRDSQAVAVGLRGGDPTRNVFGAGQSRAIRIAPTAVHAGNASGTQSVRLDLSTVVDGGVVEAPVGQVDIRFVLPAGVRGLVRSSQSLQRIDSARVTYRLQRQNVHLTNLTLVYTGGSSTVALQKRISPSSIAGAGPVRVTVTVRNLGPADARRIELRDSFDPRDFSASGTEFQAYSGDANDQRLLWSRLIPLLAVGDSVAVEYTVNALMGVWSSSLAATTASIQGELVGVSNRIRLPDPPQR